MLRHFTPVAFLVSNLDFWWRYTLEYDMCDHFETKDKQVEIMQQNAHVRFTAKYMKFLIAIYFKEIYSTILHLGCSRFESYS